MRILIDSSNYFLDNNNHGDRAIYQVMVKRLFDLWPGVEIRFITLDPALIAQTCPDIESFVLTERHLWQLFTPPQKKSPKGDNRYRRHRRLRRLFPGLVAAAQKRKVRSRQLTIVDLDRFLGAFRWADLVMATGGGYFSDAFSEHACGILDTLEGGLTFGKPAVLMSGGFEPVENALLQAKARSVLPQLNLIACREKQSGPNILRSFGVPLDHITITGDDAVELAYGSRRETLGNGIGINLRQAEYSGIDERPIETVRLVLHNAARKYEAPLVPVPISMFAPSDVESIKKLLAGYDDTSDGGGALDMPLKVLQQVSQCRLVITGSYHAAVFALSQGIPVVALVRSLHYVTKLRGLQAQFGRGCLIIATDDPDLKTILEQAIDEAWRTAEIGRQFLLEAARSQIETGRAAYRLVHKLVNTY
jgi:polysaccharide pyruvyl transferase WcaK-like protein